MFNFSSRKIGILGGMGPAATANFQRLLIETINRGGVREDSEFPTIITLSIPLSDWDHTGATDKVKVAKQVQMNLSKLRTMGAQIIAVPCNTVHEFIKGNDIVNIVLETLKVCEESKILGILCSRQTRDSRLYEICALRKHIYYPDQEAIDIVIDRVMEGKRPDISPLVDYLFESNADTVVLGCTELSLCITSSLLVSHKVIDSSRVLAEATFNRLLNL